MIQLSQAQILALHETIIDKTGGLRDEGALDSALSQPRMAFGGQDLYPTLTEKAAALGFSLIANHHFEYEDEMNETEMSLQVLAGAFL